MNETEATAPGFIVRVLNNDSTKKGLATAVAGIFVSCIVEGFWPAKT